jgi:hypothetical protein
MGCRTQSGDTADTNVGSTKQRPKRSSPFAAGFVRSLDFGYSTSLFSGDNKASSAVKGFKSHHTVPDTRAEQIEGT